MASTTPTFDQSGNFNIPGDLLVAGRAVFGAGTPRVKIYSSLTAVAGVSYVTAGAGPFTISDPPNPGSADSYNVLLVYGSAIIDGVTYAVETGVLVELERAYGFGGWTTKVSTTNSDALNASLSALTATDVANALTAANANGAVSREWFTQWQAPTTSGTPTWPDVLTSNSSAVGLVTLVNVDGIGAVAQFTPGATATANYRAAMMSNTEPYLFGAGYAFKLATSVRRGSAAVYDGSNTGHVVFGFHDYVNVENAWDGVYFRSVNGGNWFACTVSNNGGVSTVDTTIPFDETWRTLQIDINAAGTGATFLIDGVQRAFINTNIPTGSGRQTAILFKSQKVAAVANACILQSAWAMLRTTSPAALFVN